MSGDCVLRCTCCNAWEVEQVRLHQPPWRPTTFLRIRHLGYVEREFNRVADAEAYLQSKGLLDRLEEVQRDARRLILDPSMRRPAASAATRAGSWRSR